MLLTISTTYHPATDLCHLLHKHPSKLASLDFRFGRIHLFFPEATEARCTCALLLEVDPLGIVRSRRSEDAGAITLDCYLTDRTYIASSYLSTGIEQMLGHALSGRSSDRPKLVDEPIPLEVRIPVLRCSGGDPMLRRLFAPLGYEVKTQRHVLDETRSEWGFSPYYSLDLSGEARLKDLLAHLYVLLSALDSHKHTWVGHDEVDRFLAFGADWLEDHPEQETISELFQPVQELESRDALHRLTEADDTDPDLTDRRHTQRERELEASIGLQEEREHRVLEVLRVHNVRRVIDLGCGEGHILKALLADRRFDHIVGTDISRQALEIASARVRLDELAARQRSRIELIHGSLTYRDRRLEGFDAAIVSEVLEHFDPARLAAFERVVFEFAKPGLVIVTTPNAEFNVRFRNQLSGPFRNEGHRFEWTRSEFQSWAEGICDRFNYKVKLDPIGPEDGFVGAPTQMGVFLYE